MRKPCSINDCNNLSWAQTYCGKHYRRFIRHGDPNYINQKCNRDGKAAQRARQKTKNWKKKNWHYYKSYLHAVRKRVKIATPKWLTKQQRLQIINFYKNRPEGFHVDHIIPINSPLVCGLHVPWNLQYLTKEQNLKKNNKLY